MRARRGVPEPKPTCPMAVEEAEMWVDLIAEGIITVDQIFPEERP